MIKLTRIPPPDELTDQVSGLLTLDYIVNGTAVWNKTYIRTALLGMGRYKCCYCECKIDEESKYMEVDHFHHKDGFISQVAVWGNLLPACKRCNIQKGTHNTVEEPIIDPTLESPKDYLTLKAYRIKPRGQNVLGRTTIDALYLNERKRLVDIRYKIGEAIQDKLNALQNTLEAYGQSPAGGPKTRKKNIILTTIRNLLEECQPDSEYSATAATVLLQDDDYEAIKEALQTYQLWTPELQALDAIAHQASLA